MDELLDTPNLFQDLPRRGLQDQQARRPRATADRARLHPGRDDRGDAALALPAAGAALLRRPAPLPALAVARLRPGAPPRRHPLPLRPRHVWPGDAGGRRQAVRGVRLAPSFRDGARALRPAGGGEVALS